MRKTKLPPQVTWQKPEIWEIDGYKAYMYQSSNQYRNWRLLRLERPNGSIVENLGRQETGQAANISASKKNALEWLQAKVDWDIKPESERDAWIKVNSFPTLF